MKKRKIQLLVAFFIVVLLIVGVFYTVWNRKSRKNELMEKVAIENTERMEYAKRDQRPKIVVSNAKAYPGDMVTVTVSVVNNPGILGMSMALSYDNSIIELVDVKNGDAFKDVLDMTNSKSLKSGCNFLWDGENITSAQVLDGEILILEFKVLKEAKVGKTPIILIPNVDGTVDSELKTVDASVENGFLTIVE